MVAIPKRKDSTVDKIYKYYEDSQTGHRPHLGGSEIGHECSRYIWYKFRHAFEVIFPGRIIRLFNRGHREEIEFVNELRATGVRVYDVDENGKQFSFSYKDNKHFRGSIDGVAVGLIEAPATPHLLEFKTHNDKSFKALVNKAVKSSKLTHYVQMQVYMKWAGLTRALYLAVNKNTDEIYDERIRYDAKCVDWAESRAKSIINAPEPLTKISTDPESHYCKFCDARELCHNKQVPTVNCRTCCYATPTPDGNWKCDKHKKNLSNDEQAKACTYHLFIPPLIPAEFVDGDTDEGWMKYQKDDGIEFINTHTKGNGMYLSQEIEANIALLGDPGADKIREQFDAVIGK